MFSFLSFCKSETKGPAKSGRLQKKVRLQASAGRTEGRLGCWRADREAGSGAGPAPEGSTGSPHLRQGLAGGLGARTAAEQRAGPSAETDRRRPGLDQQSAFTEALVQRLQDSEGREAAPQTEGRNGASRQPGTLLGKALARGCKLTPQGRPGDTQGTFLPPGLG